MCCVAPIARRSQVLQPTTMRSPVELRASYISRCDVTCVSGDTQAIKLAITVADAAILKLVSAAGVFRGVCVARVVCAVMRV